MKSIYTILMLAFLLSAPVIAQGSGSKVMLGDPDEAKALSPFYAGLEFAFIDLNSNGIFEPTDPST